MSEPGGIGRGVVEMDVRPRHQGGPDSPRPVGRPIVHDAGWLVPAGLGLDDRLEQADQFRTGGPDGVGPTTSPVRVLSAAWSDSVPGR